MKIAICPGHYPEAPGAYNEKFNLYEHFEAIKVCQYLSEFLKNENHIVEVFQGKLKDKVEQINKGNFDLALDIHFNADYDHLDPHDEDDRRGTGCMVMYCPGVDTYGKPEPITPRRHQANKMSYVISRSLGMKNHGGRPGWYWGSNPPKSKDYFLKHTNCPAFIPEPLFIDNNKDAEWLVEEKHSSVAEAIARGIQAITELL